MSLGDELRYLRALKGGPDYAEIAQATGVPSKIMWQLEKRYRRVGEDDEVLARLAEYYGVSLEELQFHRERYRKSFSVVLAEALESQQPLSFRIRTGEMLRGIVRWWDLAAFGLDEGEGELTVVQRHAVLDWEKVDDR